jgi:hypothetical protein
MFCQVFTLCICENSQFVKKSNLNKKGQNNGEKAQNTAPPYPRA